MIQTRTIKLLPVSVANKIAAGEVVDRPASVVKELVENSFDAGATQIDIDIVAGGRRLISIRDNGYGMNRDNALMSIEKQATSKINNVEDIETIATMGFRGEALAAIASVSRFRMQTCQDGDLEGTELIINGGQLVDVQVVGCPTGTTIDVRDIFYNLPARKKFMRTAQTEQSHIRTCFLLQALAHYHVGMGLRVDGKNIYRLPADCDLQYRINDLFGVEYMMNLKALDFEYKSVKITGFAGLPTCSRPDRSEQFIFINNRPASASIINIGVQDGYKRLMRSDRRPILFLYIDMPPDIVDVNVHPAKKEVRFHFPDMVKNAISEAIRDTFSNKVDVEDNSENDPFATFKPELPKATYSQLEIDSFDTLEKSIYPKRDIIFSDEDIPESISSEMQIESQPENVEDEQNVPEKSPWKWCRYVGKIDNFYGIFELEDGYFIMNPRASHERILYEQYINAIDSNKIEIQKLLIPETIAMNVKEAERIRGCLEFLNAHGFGITEFDGNTFMVDELPVFFAKTSPKEILREISLEIESSGNKNAKSALGKEFIAKAVCYGAVRSDDNLSEVVMKRLVDDLAKTSMPYTSPSGKPTIIFHSVKELNRKFLRK
ncbi:MAG: DNA mismatch repair endonuclease MutL [Kiritimatiellae bacterium]|jgi:DNA mismatch repair protein MutL|nr:DNA mismatch repair endonuclease MutL [Kiritimatiellia bacterium]